MGPVDMRVGLVPGLVLGLVLGLAVPTVSAGQELDVELSAGAAMGQYSGAESGLDLRPGPSFGVRLDVRPTQTLAGYVGLTRSSFGCEEGFCANRDVTMTSQGLVAGARWSPGLPWVRAGLAVQGLDIDGPDASGSSDPGVGVELAGGLDFGLGERFRLRPGVRYLRHGASTDLGDGHVMQMALELGVAMTVARF